MNLSLLSAAFTIALAAAALAAPAGVSSYTFSSKSVLVNLPGTCSQLEASIGLPVEECGIYSTGELARMKDALDN